jgi:alkylhydroperoxidase/carboxymuconolactone decarboxylase family protein YurZ
MTESLYPPSSRELADKRRALAPETEKAFQVFSQQVFAGGTLPAKTKQLIAIAVAHVTSEDTPRRRSATMPPARN